MDSIVFRGRDGSLVTVAFIEASETRPSYWLVIWKMPDGQTHIERVR